MNANQAAVEAAKNMVETLQTRRRGCTTTLDGLALDRKKISFDAHSGNVHARKRLAEITQEILATEQDARSLDDAIEEAERRVKDAEDEVTNATERTKARKVLRDADEAEKLAAEADDAGRKFREALLALEQVMDRVSHAGYHGVAPSRGMQLALSRAVQTLLIGLKHVGIEVPILPPAQRHSISQTVSGAIASARTAAQRILETKQAA